jgi:NDP-sugar pyrophosphorylase family protein
MPGNNLVVLIYMVHVYLLTGESFCSTTTIQAKVDQILVHQLYKDLINKGAEMAVASTEYKIDVPYAVFETEDSKVLEFKEKPSFVYYSNAGIYILNRKLIEKIPKNKFYDITELMEDLVQEKGKLVHSPIRGYWIDIGKPVDYKQAQEFIKHAKQ